jgi:Flp pilus assembly protein TadD
MTGGSPEIAVNVSRGILVRDPFNIPAQMMLGNALYALQLFPQAEASYASVLKVQPNNAAAHLGLGRVKLAERDSKTAEEQFRLAAQQEPRAETFSNLGVALDLQQRPEAAQAEYRRSLELDPGSAATRLNLALSLLASGDRTGARAALQPLLAGPANGELASNIAAAQRAIENQTSGRPSVIPSASSPVMLNAPQ